MLTAPIANAPSTCGDVHAKSVPAHAQASRIAETPTLSTPRPQPVDLVLTGAAAGAHRAHHDHEREGGQREVDPEDPAPGDAVGERAAEQRARHGGRRPDAADVALVAAALPRREQVRDRRLAQRQQPTGPEALQRAERDQLRHVLGEPAQGGADEEQADRDHEQPPAPVQVAELAVERDGHRARQQVRGDHPAQVLEALQVGRDLRQRRGHDRLVERGQQRREHDRGEGDQHLPLRTFGDHRTVYGTSASIRSAIRRATARSRARGSWMTGGAGR